MKRTPARGVKENLKPCAYVQLKGEGASPPDSVPFGV